MAVLDPDKIPVDQLWRYQVTIFENSPESKMAGIRASALNSTQLANPESINEAPTNETTLHFRYFLGDRSGVVHVADEQVMDLKRPEIDLPFGVNVYHGGYAGFAPITIIHGVEIWTQGVIDHMKNVTIRRNGIATLEYLGNTEWGHIDGK